MNTFDTTKSIISAEDLLDGVDFINEFSNELATYPNRLTGTEEETACARAIRNRLHDESNVKTRLEAYKSYPMLGRGCFPFLGLWYALSLVLYYVSFVGNRIAGVLLTLLALVVFVSGGIVLGLLFLGNRKFKGLLTTKVSYNVISEFAKPYSNAEDKKEKVFIILDNHDALMGSYVKDFGKLRTITMMIGPISAVLFVLFCILKMAIGAQTAAQISVFVILPAIFGMFGIAVLLTHFSPFPQHARQNNGVATSVAMATYAYFAENPDKLEEGTRVVYVSLGGENAAHGGSEAFIKSHPEYSNAKVLCLGDIQSGDLKIADKDAMRNINFSTPLVSIIRSSAHEQDIEIGTIPTDGISNKIKSLHGYLSNEFAKNGMQTATIIAKDHSAEEKVLDRNDVEKLFSLTVGTFKKLMHEKAIDERVSVGEEKPSTDMTIMDVKGK